MAMPRMHAVTFDGCFGWLHAPRSDAAADRAVVICQGLTHDHLSGHRPFRLLADALAADGYPVLRFDYPDTGNSADVADAEHWSLWQDRISAAIDWLLTHTHATRVVLIGLRIGATLAALAAERRGDVAALVMLEPVVRGRTYVRQMVIEQMVNRSSSGVAVSSGLDSHGLRMSPEMLRRIEAVDLRQIRPPANCRVAVHTQATTPVLSAFLDAWRDAGGGITAAGFDGLTPFLRPTYLNHEAPADTAPILAWLRQEGVRTGRAMPPAPGYVPLQEDGWVETPLRFGAAQQLFGMLCRPPNHDGSGAGAGLAVVMLNTSGIAQYGTGRLSVALARRLAAEGVASLRMDFAGLGDSIGEAGDAPSHILETDREADISAALDALQALGYRRFALHGLCTGAYHALYGAVADRRVDALVLVNLPMFTWRRGDPVDMIGIRKPGAYLRRLGERQTWVLSRQRRRRIGRLAYAALFRLRLAVTERLMPRPAPRAQASFGQRCLTILSGRQARTLFLYAADDPGLPALEQEFAPDGLPPADAAELRIVVGLDHSLSRSAMRKIAVDHIAGFLKQLPAA